MSLTNSNPAEFLRDVCRLFALNNSSLQATIACDIITFIAWKFWNDAVNEQEIFLEALNLESSEERLGFIRQRCGSDNALRKRLEALLQAHAETGNFLGSPAIGSVSDVRSQITEDAGTIIGPYNELAKGDLALSTWPSSRNRSGAKWR